MSHSPESSSNSLLLLVRVLLALGLMGALLFAGWRIYRRLPAEAANRSVFVDGRPQVALRLVVRNRIAGATLRSPIEFFHFNLNAARREYEESPRLARQFDDFLMRRMHNVTPVKADVNSDGYAVAQLWAGDWWLRAKATINGSEEIEWRVPVSLSDRDQSLELSFENAYERTKKF
jgi:hypothetical protein